MAFGLICAISKLHNVGQRKGYWFGYHPHQRDFLSEFQTSYVSFGCGSPDKTFLIPFSAFEPLVKNLHTTKLEERMYWHIIIQERDKQYLLQQPYSDGEKFVDITRYKL